MSVDAYWSVIGKWRRLKFKDVRGLNLVITRVTITRIRDKFEVDGTVQDVFNGRWGRKRSSTYNESAGAVMQDFAWTL